MGVWFASKSLRTSPIVWFKMVAQLSTQKVSKFSAWEILSKRLDVSPETRWQCRRLREHSVPAGSGLLRVTSGHLHLLSLLFPSWHLVLEGSGSQERGRRYCTPPPFPASTCPWPKHCFSIQLSDFKHGGAGARKYNQISCWAPNIKQGKPRNFKRTRFTRVFTRLQVNLNLEVSPS